MIFANSFVLLLGGLLVSIPIVLHFLMQPKPKMAIFPAIRFLQEHHLATRRQLNIRHRVLLALRTLLILLLALALAGPSVAEVDFGKWLWAACFGAMTLITATLWGLSKAGKKANPVLNRLLMVIALGCLATAGFLTYRAINEGSAASIGNNADPVTAFVVIDNSPRMTYLRDNQSNFDRAKEMADWVLSQLPADSQISVKALSDEDPFYSVDLAAAKKRIGSFDISYLPLPLPEVVRGGLEFLKDARQERREIYVITDLTKPSWASSTDLKSKLARDSNVSVFLIDVGTANPTNIAINEIRLDADKLSTASKLSLEATITSTTDEALRTVQLAIEKPDYLLPIIQDGKTRVPGEFWFQSESVSIPKNGSINVAFQFGQSLPVGIHHGTLTIIGGDGLAIDDQRFFTIEIREVWQVLVVAPENVNSNNLVYLLSPEKLMKVGAAPFNCLIIKPQEIGNYDLSQFQTIYLLDPPPLEETTWSTLKNYVSLGGGLAIFLGNNARRGPVIDKSFLEGSAPAILGGQITNLFERPARPGETGESLWYLSPSDMSHPIFKLIRPIESTLAWYQFPIYYHWGLDVDETPEYPTQVLLRYSNHEPAIVERLIGDGRVLTMTTSITESRKPEAWNALFTGKTIDDLPVATFLLIKQLANYLAQIQQDTLNIQTGQIAILKNDLRNEPDAYTLFTPEPNQAPTRLVSSQDQVRYKFTDFPGHYRLKGSKEDKPVLRGFSANFSPSMTDLTRIGKEQLDEFFGEDRYQISRDKIEVQRQQGTSRKGQEFYPLIIAMMCIVFGLEYIMANRFYSKEKNEKGLLPFSTKSA